MKDYMNRTTSNAQIPTMVITMIEMVKPPERWDKMAHEHGRQGWQQERRSGKWDPS